MGDRSQPADEGKTQAQDREAKSAQPSNATDNEKGPERYPPVRQDDAVEAEPEPRNFGGESRRMDPVENPRPAAAKADRFGPAGGPADGKR